MWTGLLCKNTAVAPKVTVSDLDIASKTIEEPEGRQPDLIGTSRDCILLTLRGASNTGVLRPVYVLVFPFLFTLAILLTSIFGKTSCPAF